MVDRNQGGGPARAPVYESIAGMIKAMGIEKVFGLISDDIAHLVASIDAMGLKFHNARHENQAVMMGVGYAMATGRLGVVAIGRGPAMANAVHAITAARRSGMPVLIVAGDNPLNKPANGLGPDLKDFDIPAVMAAIGVRVFRPTDPRTATIALADAASAAMAGTVTMLLLSAEIQLTEVIGEALPLPTPFALSPRSPSPTSLAAAAKLIEGAQRPLIVAGIGAYRSGAGKALEDLADRIGALLVTTLKAKDLFRANPHNLGILGSSSYSVARRYIDQADCVLAFGASLNFLTTNSGLSLPQAPLIHCDSVRTNIGRWWHADATLVGDAKLTAEALLELLPARGDAQKPFHTEQMRRALEEFDPHEDFETMHTARTVDPRELAMALNQLLPRDRNIVWDGGNFLGVLPYLSVPDPGSMMTTSDFASIGLGFGGAMGFAAGRPGTPTVLMVGDGGLFQTLGELETVVRESIPLVVIVMNDCAYGAELHLLRLQNMPIAMSMFPDIDFAPVAAAFGYDAHTIRSMDDLRELSPLLSQPDGPILLDCKINANIAAPFIAEFIKK